MHQKNQLNMTTLSEYEVLQVLIDLANQQPEIMKDPLPSAFFLEHGDSTLNFELRFFVPDTSYRLPLTDRMNTLINKEFTAREIVIACPQRDVHLIMENVPENVKTLAQDVLKKRNLFHRTLYQKR